VSARSLALLVALAALWGGSFVFMRVAAPPLGAIALAFTRVTLAGAALLAFAALAARIPAWRERWRDFAVVGVVNSALPFLFFAYAGQYITASTAAILNATSPLFAALAAAIWLGEPLTWRKGAGMAVGLAGVAVLVGWHPDTMDRHTLLAIGACLAATVCYALGGTYVKQRLAGVPSFAIACASQVAASLALAPVAPFASVPGPVDALVVANVVALALGSTAIAYLIYFRLIAEAGPTRALTVTFLIPLFGVLWGTLFLGEPLSPNLLTGGTLVVAGTALVIVRQGRP
jgi:drug/metabolite transporter (DMT)-like permease